MDQPRYLWTDKWIENLVYIHNGIVFGHREECMEMKLYCLLIKNIFLYSCRRHMPYTKLWTLTDNEKWILIIMSLCWKSAFFFARNIHLTSFTCYELFAMLYSVVSVYLGVYWSDYSSKRIITLILQLGRWIVDAGMGSVCIRGEANALTGDVAWEDALPSCVSTEH